MAEEMRARKAHLIWVTMVGLLLADLLKAGLAKFNVKIPAFGGTTPAK